MKVIGTGAPEVLTARLERCELDPLLADLRGQRGVVTDALMHEMKREAATPSENGAEELDRLHGELFELSRLIDEVEQAAARADEPVAITGPTSLIGQPLGCRGPDWVVRLATAGRGPTSLASVKARMRPAPPGGASCRKRQQDVAPVRARL